MTVLSLKETDSGQNICRVLVSTESLIASWNQVLRYAADVVKMIRIIVNIFTLKNAKKLMMPIFITAIVAKTYFVAGFFAQFCLFCCFKKFLISALNQS